ncbi:hypothetical protein [Zavarzinia compransoris]|uniref:Uncharacterized protein n=1 Tax=Zavarzinia compransoris TaxID=1264899 RepID=A0A317DWN0_9PROT|nr:hypothetical protein [Zavarzinia compransoris]PWR18360.1 hypothetical protein DKG75_20570 [Zavarzinia compransoris]TDP43577.1 hypothetical protein DES42_1104 [Zavarzinia compransoris]
MISSLRTLLLTAGLLLPSASALAEDIWHYFSGSHRQQDGKLILDEVIARVDENNTWKVSIYFAEQGAAIRGYKAAGWEQDGRVLLNDAKSGQALFRLEFGEDRSQIRGRWLARNGQPDECCDPVSLTAAASPLDRARDHIAVLKTGAPDLTDAQAAIAYLGLPLPDETLPDLDRQRVLDEAAREYRPFWTRFWSEERKRLAGLPTGTPDERRQLVERATFVTAVTFAPQPPRRNETVRDRDQLEFMKAAIETLAGRLEAAGETPRALWAGQDLCARAAAFGRPSLDTLVHVSGLPLVYWTRLATESAIRELKLCRDLGSTYVDFIVAKWPAIEQDREIALWLSAERKRIGAAPGTIAGLRDLGWLVPPAEELKQRGIGADRYTAAVIQSFLLEKGAELEQAYGTAFGVLATTLRDDGKIKSSDIEAACLALLGPAPSGVDAAYGATWTSDLKLTENGMRGVSSYFVLAMHQCLKTGQSALVEAAIAAQLDAWKKAPRTPETFVKTHGYDPDMGEYLRGYILTPEQAKAFEGHVAGLRKEAEAGYESELREALNSLDLDKPLGPQPLYQKAETLCRDFGNISGDWAEETCRAEAKALEKRACDHAMERADVPGDYQDALFDVDLPFGTTDVSGARGAMTRSLPLREFICRSLDNGAAVHRIIFTTSGYLWWAESVIEIKDLYDTDKEAIVVILAPIEGHPKGAIGVKEAFLGDKKPAGDERLALSCMMTRQCDLWAPAMWRK